MTQPLSTLTPPVTPEAIELASRWLEALGAEQGWPAKLVFGLTLSMDEALTNILMHGFANSPAHRTPRIRLECHLDGAEVEIRIIDNGQAFDPTTLAPPQAAESVTTAKIGGHGVQLMRHYLKRLGYARHSDENRLSLIADLNAGAA